MKIVKEYPTKIRAKVYAWVLAGCLSLSAIAQDRPLTLLAKPKPPYTDLARQNCIIGFVRLKVVFKADGSIGTISVEKALPFGLTETAIAAARRIKFEPTLVNGISTTTSKPVEYSFDIYTDENDDKDIKHKAKIKVDPVFDLSDSDLKSLRSSGTKLKISLRGDGIASLYEVNPNVDDTIRQVLEQGVSRIKFSPAVLKGGCSISVTREIKL